MHLSLISLRPDVDPWATRTIELASNALISKDKQIISKDKRIAEVEKRLAEVSAASAGDDDLALVASGGGTIMVKASLARSASPYFDTALASGFEEAGAF